MPGVVLDLAIKVIPSDQRIWVVFPGKGRKFLAQFLSERIIFVDTPGIRLDGEILEDALLGNARRLRQHIAMSVTIANYHNGHTETLPSRQYSAYRAARGNVVGLVETMFIDMKPRDLILISGKSMYAPFYIGEITKPFDPGEDVTQVSPYGRDEIPYRKVKWLPIGRPERRFLPERLYQLLSNEKAVISISRADFGELIFRYAYGDYVFGENSRYVYHAPNYDNRGEETIPGLQLISYFAAAYHANAQHKINEFAALSIRDAIRAFSAKEDLYSFEIDFHSPGSYILHAKKAAIPLVVALLVSATSGSLSFAAAQSAEIENSAAVIQAVPGEADYDDGLVPISEQFHGIVEGMGAARFNEMVKLNKDAQQGPGLQVGVKQK